MTDAMKRQELFDAGAQARREHGTEYGEYDLVVYGIAAVLRGAGIEGEDLEDELSSRFHNPLAMIKLETPIDAIAAQMASRIGASKTYPVECAMRGELYWTFRSSIPSWRRRKGGYGLRKRLQDMQKAMAAGGQQRATIAKARGWGRGILRRIEIVEALGADTGALEEVKAEAQRAIEAADRMEERCQEKIEVLRQYLENLPTEQARELRPLSELRTGVRKGWEHTISSRGAGLISDGVAIVEAGALYAARCRDLYARTETTVGDRVVDEEGRVPPDAVRSLWDAQTSKPSRSVLVGWRETGKGGTGYAFTSDGDMHFFDPHRLACIQKWTKRSLGPFTVRCNADGAFVCLRGGEPVAVVAAWSIGKDSPLRDVDADEARRVLDGDGE